DIGADKQVMAVKRLEDRPQIPKIAAMRENYGLAVDVHPWDTRARPRLESRGLQMSSRGVVVRDSDRGRTATPGNVKFPLPLLTIALWLLFACFNLTLYFQIQPNSCRFGLGSQGRGLGDECKSHHLR